MSNLLYADGVFTHLGMIVLALLIGAAHLVHLLLRERRDNREAAACRAMVGSRGRPVAD